MATTIIINILSQTVPVTGQSIQLLAIGYTGFRGGTLMFLHGNKQAAVFSQFAESIISEKHVCSFTFFSLSLIGRFVTRCLNFQELRREVVYVPKSYVKPALLTGIVILVYDITFPWRRAECRVTWRCSASRHYGNHSLRASLKMFIEFF